MHHSAPSQLIEPNLGIPSFGFTKVPLKHHRAFSDASTPLMRTQSIVCSNRFDIFSTPNQNLSSQKVSQDKNNKNENGSSP